MILLFQPSEWLEALAHAVMPNLIIHCHTVLSYSRHLSAFVVGPCGVPSVFIPSSPEVAIVGYYSEQPIWPPWSGSNTLSHCQALSALPSLALATLSPWLEIQENKNSLIVVSTCLSNLVIEEESVC